MVRRCGKSEKKTPPVPKCVGMTQKPSLKRAEAFRKDKEAFLYRQRGLFGICFFALPRRWAWSVGQALPRPNNVEEHSTRDGAPPPDSISQHGSYRVSDYRISSTGTKVIFAMHRFITVSQKTKCVAALLSLLSKRALSHPSIALSQCRIRVKPYRIIAKTAWTKHPIITILIHYP